MIRGNGENCGICTRPEASRNARMWKGWIGIVAMATKTTEKPDRYNIAFEAVNFGSKVIE